MFGKPFIDLRLANSFYAQLDLAKRRIRFTKSSLKGVSKKRNSPFQLPSQNGLSHFRPDTLPAIGSMLGFLIGISNRSCRKQKLHRSLPKRHSRYHIHNQLHLGSSSVSRRRRGRFRAIHHGRRQGNQPLQELLHKQLVLRSGYRCKELPW